MIDRDRIGVVLHVPHSSRHVPEHVREQFLLDDESLERELLAMTDAHTDALFGGAVSGAAEVVFPVSRLVVDPERFVEDDHEPMSRVGMGVVYERTIDGQPLRRCLDARERIALLREYYEPHHAALQRAVDEALSRDGACLVVDCHSFPSVPLPYELDQDRDRPDICLGTDPFHTPEPLARAAHEAFRATGLKVSWNRPFAGALVPASHYRRDGRVSAIMIEVNRGLYIDESTRDRLQRFDDLRTMLRVALASITVRR